MRITDDLILLWFLEKEEEVAKRHGVSISDIIFAIENRPEEIKNLIKSNFFEMNTLAALFFREPVLISNKEEEAEVFFSYYKKYFLGKKEKITIQV